MLATRDNKGKIRIVSVSLLKKGTDNEPYYIIERYTGLYGGKQTKGPVIEIREGKVKRTVEEQAQLKYNSLIKEYKDKGYIEIDQTLPIEDQVPESKRDQNGSLKPMLCKVIDFDDKNLLNKTWYASFKLDGTRASLFLKDGQLTTASRGGQDYNLATTYIRENPYVKDVFARNPDLILDGEIYRHGWPLNKISGLCRLETLCEDHKQLCFHCYDLVDESKTFEERYAILKTIASTNKLVIVPHTKFDAGTDLDTFKKELMKYHDNAIALGYEGAVIRDGKALYKCGGRDRRMQKIKMFSDREDKIIDIVEGLRDEDMCFLMEMPDGKQYKAKPIGTREDKEWYRANISKIKGKKGTVKHFGYGANGVPNLPVFKNIRDEKDM